MLHVCGVTLAADGGRNKKPAFAQAVAPFLTSYCTRCHGGKKPKAELALDAFADEKAALKEAEIWDRVARALKGHEMPPEGRKQPSADEVKAVLQWIDVSLVGESCVGPRNPGRVTVRRLNRSEYNNTIRDLVGIDFHPAEDFPADDVGYGFDNIGDVLSLPPLLMEKYLAAAELIVGRAMSTPEVRSRILFSKPNARNEIESARKIVERFARHAYRRPLNSEEVNRLVNFVRLARKQGDSFDKGIELALEAILTSPYFIFRVERDRKTTDPNAAYRISEYELATRLSYFLWSSMPDDELLRVANKGNLHEDDVLETQVERMLKDPRAHALVENFAGQWLQIRNLRNATPDTGRFPEFDEPLRLAMAKETELFFEWVLNENRSILDFIDSDYTFLNERLAKHYGIEGVRGDGFRKVHLFSGNVRGGILTQGSVLTLTSNPTRTSPVKRGKWILENVLGTPPPPPPPGAGELSDDKDVVLTGSLRKRMEQHRANPNCASCHQRMDPLGFAFENFDAVGKWRDKDGDFAIDPAGTLPGGRNIQGPAELKKVLKEQSQQFCHCLAEKMLTYALGRGMEAYDKCALDQLTAAVAKQGFRMQTMITEIVKSDPFQKRRARGKT
jgi:mono/diheme cytochrome c family protein